MELISKGTFSKVYKLNDDKVLIKSDCWAKETYAYFLKHSIFPDLMTVDYQVYECEYYPKVKSLKNSLTTEYWEIYKDLRSLNIGYVKNPYDLLYLWRGEFKKIKNDYYRDALLEALDALSNYGSQIRFEISPRNVAVKDGKLILLDCFFFQDQLQTKRIKYNG